MYKRFAHFLFVYLNFNFVILYFVKKCEKNTSREVYPKVPNSRRFYQLFRVFFFFFDHAKPDAYERLLLLLTKQRIKKK